MAMAEPHPLRSSCDGGGRVSEGGRVLPIHLCRRGFDSQYRLGGAEGLTDILTSEIVGNGPLMGSY